MSTKLKIKMGHIEFEYEGDAVYDKEAVKDLFSHIESMMVSVPKAFDTPPSFGNGDAPVGGKTGELANLGMNTVAARLDVKSGPDLVMCASAYLQICQGKPTFSRRELLKAMQEATSHYNSGMNKNLSNFLKALITGKRLNSLAEDKMSLAASEIGSMKAKLAQS